MSSESLDSTSDAEYESHVESWRAQSAEAREKAEKERARWEAIRAAEKQEAALRHAAIPDDGGAVGGEIISDHGWETVGKTQEVRRSSSPSPADARDLVTGEPQKHVGQANVCRARTELHPNLGRRTAGRHGSKFSVCARHWGRIPEMGGRLISSHVLVPIPVFPRPNEYALSAPFSSTRPTRVGNSRDI